MSDSSSATDFPYLHGFSPTEQARLVKQARLAESTIFHDIDYSGVRNLLEVGFSPSMSLKKRSSERLTASESSLPLLMRRVSRSSRSPRHAARPRCAGH